MRISYALIIAAIAVMEGCKPKDAITTSGDGDKKNGEKKENGGGDGAELDEEGEGEGGDDQGGEEEEGDDNGDDNGGQGGKLRVGGKKGKRGKDGSNPQNPLVPEVRKSGKDKAAEDLAKAQQAVDQAQAALASIDNQITEKTRELEDKNAALATATRELQQAEGAVPTAKRGLITALIEGRECPVPALPRVVLPAAFMQAFENAANVDRTQQQLRVQAQALTAQLRDSSMNAAHREALTATTNDLIEKLQAEAAGPAAIVAARTGLINAIKAAVTPVRYALVGTPLMLAINGLQANGFHPERQAVCDAPVPVGSPDSIADNHQKFCGLHNPPRERANLVREFKQSFPEDGPGPANIPQAIWDMWVAIGDHDDDDADIDDHTLLHLLRLIDANPGVVAAAGGDADVYTAVKNAAKAGKLALGYMNEAPPPAAGGGAAPVRVAADPARDTIVGRKQTLIALFDADGDHSLAGDVWNHCLPHYAHRGDGAALAAQNMLACQQAIKDAPEPAANNKLRQAKEANYELEAAEEWVVARNAAKDQLLGAIPPAHAQINDGIVGAAKASEAAAGDAVVGAQTALLRAVEGLTVPEEVVRPRNTLTGAIANPPRLAEATNAAKAACQAVIDRLTTTPDEVRVQICRAIDALRDANALGATAPERAAQIERATEALVNRITSEAARSRLAEVTEIATPLNVFVEAIQTKETRNREKNEKEGLRNTAQDQLAELNTQKAGLVERVRTAQSEFDQADADLTKLQPKKKGKAAAAAVADA